MSAPANPWREAVDDVALPDVVPLGTGWPARYARVALTPVPVPDPAVRLAALDDAVARGEPLPAWRCPACHRLRWAPLHLALWWAGWCRLPALG